MPEGDTVWHTAAVLRDALAGKALTRCDIRVPRYATVDLTGQVVDEVISRGKHLFIRVGHASIHSHLKMEGSWKISPLDKPSRAGHRIRIIMEAGDVQAAGIDLGVLEVLERDADMDVVAHLGPDLLGDNWDPRTAATNLTADPDRPLAEALLDQRVMAGVGNGTATSCASSPGIFRQRRSARSKTRCEWCSGHGICCGSIGPDGIAPPTGDTRGGRELLGVRPPGKPAGAAGRRSAQTAAVTASLSGARFVSRRSHPAYRDAARTAHRDVESLRSPSDCR